jgi:hypothetical protein
MGVFLTILTISVLIVLIIAHIFFLVENDGIISNQIIKDYLDKLYTLDWDKNTSYQPSFARPNFDYRHLVGVNDNNNISEKIDLPLFDCMLNTQNFFINKSEYVDQNIVNF